MPELLQRSDLTWECARSAGGRSPSKHSSMCAFMANGSFVVHPSLPAFLLLPSSLLLRFCACCPSHKALRRYRTTAFVLRIKL